MTIDTLTIIFELELKPHEVPLFRGAVINALSEKNVLFHNHEGDSFRFRYPLIQYKALRGNAAIVCLGEGTNAIGEFFASGNFDIVIGDRNEKLKLKNVFPRRHNIQVWEQAFHYRLRRWLPLNGVNYRIFVTAESLDERCSILEKILCGNILSMGKGLGIDFNQQVECRISEIGDLFMANVKGVKMMCFNIDFVSNVSLPSHIGLGKHASLGFGTVLPCRPAKHSEETR